VLVLPPKLLDPPLEDPLEALLLLAELAELLLPELPLEPWPPVEDHPPDEL